MHVSELGRVMETDVLVLGAGAAGSLAAIGAREQGAKCILVDKGVVESCGCIGAGQGYAHCHFNSGEEWDSDEAEARWMAIPGFPFNIAMETYSKLTEAMVHRLESYGIEFVKNPDGTYWQTPWAKMPGKGFQIALKNGRWIKRIVAREVRKAGAECVGHIMATKILLNDNGQAVGAVGFHARTGEFYIFKSKTVVICLGGTQERIRTRPNMPNAFNCWLVPTACGTGIVMPYEAGLNVVSLEVSGLPVTTFPKGFGSSGGASFGAFGCRMLKSDGDPYLERVSPRGMTGPRPLQATTTWRETIEGRGPCYLECRHIEKEKLEDLIHHVTQDKSSWNDYLEQKGLDFRKDMIEEECSALQGGGMLVKNERCECIPSGKRMYGSLIPGTTPAMCGGHLAATSAAIDSRGIELEDPDIDQVAQEKEKVYSFLGRKEGYTPKEYDDMIRQVMNYYVGFYTNEENLGIALTNLKKIEDHADEIKASNPHELLRANEAVHLLKYCQLYVNAVKARKETRGRGGSWFRSDYPERDKAYDGKCVVLWQENGELKIEIVNSDESLYAEDKVT